MSLVKTDSWVAIRTSKFSIKLRRQGLKDPRWVFHHMVKWRTQTTFSISKTRFLDLFFLNTFHSPHAIPQNKICIPQKFHFEERGEFYILSWMESNDFCHSIIVFCTLYQSRTGSRAYRFPIGFVGLFQPWTSKAPICRFVPAVDLQGSSYWSASVVGPLSFHRRSASDL